MPTISRAPYPLLQRFPAQAEVGRAEGDVLPDPGHEQLVVRVLEDDPDAAADLGEIRPGDRQAGDGDRAGAGGQDAVEVEDQGGLARAVGAEQRHPFPGVDVQVDTEQGLVSVRVGVGEAADIEDGCGHGGGIRPE